MTSSRPDSLRIAAFQPAVVASAPEADRVGEAVEAIRRAAADGARLIVFPEGYPGPLRASSSYDAAPALSQAAAGSRCAVCWSRLERGADRRFRKVAYLFDEHGRQVMRYERAHPATGDVHPTLSGVSLAPGPVLGFGEVFGIPVGVLICSELWLPEVARSLAVRGAELLLAPAGGGFGKVAENWQLIARARAIENEAYVVLTQHLFGGEQGAALIAGPEAVVSAATSPGVLVGDIDLARLRWLRATDDSMANPKPFTSLPGLLRARRPELYAGLSAPVDGLYDYERAATAPDADVSSVRSASY